MAGRIRFWSGAFGASVLAVVLSGCTTLPDFAERDFIKMESLFYSVEQELCESLALIKGEPGVAAKLREAGVSIDRQYAKVTAGLELMKVLDAGGNATFVIPVNNGNAGLGLGATSRRVNSVRTTVSVYYPFTELECTGQIANPPERIAGGLGLKEWILNTTVALINVRETPAAYSYEVSFDVTRDARARPTISLATSGFTLIGGDLSLGGARKLTHWLSVTVRDVALDDAPASRGGIPTGVRDALDREEGLAILRRVKE
ncbi:hypothetical protein EJC49_18075 [Aquibium carbonis]|uniref:Uncharacterized protein n=1 Tax=Aquibium carbonis TaxID=2495581 RepID=A0A3R9Y625_9HYPH|nr:hypothetical protein [Aquibium carbonis]RST84987.1 hypothetical protein EJC49_18075 [Aquibium carbonis]